MLFLFPNRLNASIKILMLLNGFMNNSKLYFKKLQSNIFLIVVIKRSTNCCSFTIKKSIEKSLEATRKSILTKSFKKKRIVINHVIHSLN